MCKVAIGGTAEGQGAAAEELTATAKRRLAERKALEEAERVAHDTQSELDAKFGRPWYSALLLPSEVEALAEAAAAPAATGSDD